jgi:hypothetical protein
MRMRRSRHADQMEALIGPMLLIYGLGVSPADAVAISLVAVAATACVGAVQSLRHRLVVWQPSILFALGAGTGHRANQEWLVVAFALLAVVVGGFMWRASLKHPEQAAAVRALPRQPGGGPICVLSPDGQLRFTAPCALVLVTRMGVHRAMIAPRLCFARTGEIASSPIEQTRDDGRHEPSGRRDSPVGQVHRLYVQQLCERRDLDDYHGGR